MNRYTTSPFERSVDNAISAFNRATLDAKLDELDLRMIERVWHEIDLPHDSSDCSICREAQR